MKRDGRYRLKNSVAKVLIDNLLARLAIEPNLVTPTFQFQGSLLAANTEREVADTLRRPLSA